MTTPVMEAFTEAAKITLKVGGEWSGKNFPQASEGVHAAVCVDLVDLGMQPNKYNDDKEVHRLMLKWQVEERAENAPVYISKFYTASLHPKANLRKDLEAWLGKPMEDGEFALESVVGLQAKLTVVQNTSKEGKVYANIVSVKPSKKVITADPYTRPVKKDKK